MHFMAPRVLPSPLELVPETAACSDTPGAGHSIHLHIWSTYIYNLHLRFELRTNFLPSLSRVALWSTNLTPHLIFWGENCEPAFRFGTGCSNCKLVLITTLEGNLWCFQLPACLFWDSLIPSIARTYIPGFWKRTSI